MRKDTTKTFRAAQWIERRERGKKIKGKICNFPPRHGASCPSRQDGRSRAGRLPRHEEQRSINGLRESSAQYLTSSPPSVWMCDCVFFFIPPFLSYFLSSFFHSSTFSSLISSHLPAFLSFSSSFIYAAHLSFPPFLLPSPFLFLSSSLPPTPPPPPSLLLIPSRPSSPPGIDLIVAFYGCLYAGCVPITVRPPHPQNIATTLPTVKMIVEVKTL